jgi:adenosylmethionine-8-amino-7-oxononanoate aminotransferase
LPKGLNHLFYASDGSSAVEAALKIGLQYWWNKGVEGKNKFVYLENSYHGDTLAAVSVGYVDTFHQPFKHVMWPNLAAPSPLTTNTRPENKTIETWNEESFQPMAKLLRESCKEVAAVIVEPICQAVGGMRIYSPDYLKRLSKLCKELGVLLIADEIAVGFGRTGVMFACEYADISPDMVIIGKGMTSGFIPMSALAATTEVYDSFRNESANPEKNRTFFHGHTYSGHPLAAACARATLKVFKEEGIIESLSPKSKIIEDGFKELSKLIPGSKWNSIGMIGVVDVPSEVGGVEAARAVAAHARELGLYIRPLGDVLYLFPPLTASEGELQKMVELLSISIRSKF